MTALEIAQATLHAFDSFMLGVAMCIAILGLSVAWSKVAKWWRDR